MACRHLKKFSGMQRIQNFTFENEYNSMRERTGRTVTSPCCHGVYSRCPATVFTLLLTFRRCVLCALLSWLAEVVVPATKSTWSPSNSWLFKHILNHKRDRADRYTCSIRDVWKETFSPLTLISRSDQFIEPDTQRNPPQFINWLRPTLVNHAGCVYYTNRPSVRRGERSPCHVQWGRSRSWFKGTEHADVPKQARTTSTAALYPTMIHCRFICIHLFLISV